jgi:uncharacterized protein
MVDNNPAARQGWAVPVLVSIAILLPQFASGFKANSAQTALTATQWLANGMFQSLSQVVLLAVIIGASGRSREFGLVQPRPKDILPAALVFGGMLLMGRIAAFAVKFLAPDLDIPTGIPSALSPAPDPGETLSPAAMMALAAGFALASAYREELFYRAYLLGACRLRSAPPGAAIVVSVVLFAWGHAYQGPAGMAAAVLIGLFLAIAWSRGTSVHALAWGHGAYNMGILVLSLPRVH